MSKHGAEASRCRPRKVSDGCDATTANASYKVPWQCKLEPVPVSMAAAMCSILTLGLWLVYPYITPTDPKEPENIALDAHALEEHVLATEAAQIVLMTDASKSRLRVALAYLPSAPAIAAHVAAALELPQLLAYALRPTAAPLSWELYSQQALGPLFGVGVSADDALAWGGVARAWVSVIIVAMALKARRRLRPLD